MNQGCCKITTLHNTTSLWFYKTVLMARRYFSYNAACTDITRLWYHKGLFIRCWWSILVVPKARPAEINLSYSSIGTKRRLSTQIDAHPNKIVNKYPERRMYSITQSFSGNILGDFWCDSLRFVSYSTIPKYLRCHTNADSSRHFDWAIFIINDNEAYSKYILLSDTFINERFPSRIERLPQESMLKQA